MAPSYSVMSQYEYTVSNQKLVLQGVGMRYYAEKANNPLILCRTFHFEYMSFCVHTILCIVNVSFQIPGIGRLLLESEGEV